ncbi:MAG: Superoxide dismutase [Mn], partial [uncultured Rubrobacteraceae bacterium]
DADRGAGRVGARLLPQVPEPPPGVHKRLLGRGQLGRGRPPLRRRQVRL